MKFIEGPQYSLHSANVHFLHGPWIIIKELQQVQFDRRDMAFPGNSPNRKQELVLQNAINMHSAFILYWNQNQKAKRLDSAWKWHHNND